MRWLIACSFTAFQCRRRQNPPGTTEFTFLQELSGIVYTEATNKLRTNTHYTQFGEKEFSPHQVRSMHGQRFLPDADYIDVLTGWYQPVLTNFNSTLNFRPGPPPWPPPNKSLRILLLLPQTPPTSSSYAHYRRTFPRQSYQLACVVRPTTPLQQTKTYCAP